MRYIKHLLPAVAILGVALAGCSTTPHGEDYSSLPPAPQHPAGSKAGLEAPIAYGGTRDGLADVQPGQHADLFDRIRAGYALPDTQHYAVDRELEWYRSRPDYLDRIFRRGARYLYYIVTEIEKRGMPLELALLPVVESAFNPVAYSRSHAAGLWQFIPSTGKHYGLTQNWWIDERRDVLRATDAALNYLQYLNRYFNGDWYLAIAAYNGGEGTVSRAVKRNADAGRPADFFSLNLKAETRDYVPKLLAISRIVANPPAYGLSFAAIPNQPYFDVVDPGKQIHLGEASELAGISRDDMFALNPAFNRMTTPPGGPHRLLLPVNRAEPFRIALANGETAQRVAATTVEPPPELRHRVRSGESLTGIARQHGVSVDSLRARNGLRGSVIHPGDILMVPRDGATATAPVAESRPDIVAQLPERLPPAGRATAPAGASSAAAAARSHKVKPGETLWGVARRYGVTVPALAAENGMTSKSQLVAGSRLKIPGAGGTGGPDAPAAESSRMTYKVRRGDTLTEIAQRFNVSVQQLKAWNQIRQSNSLKAGQKIVVYVDPRRVSGG
jgi:membrane-bound lytic murein transglycosylase D